MFHQAERKNLLLRQGSQRAVEARVALVETMKRDRNAADNYPID